MEPKISIAVINDFGGGFSGPMEVPAGTTVGQLFEQLNPGQMARNFLIRVNRDSTTADRVLQPEDKVSVTPLKVTGQAA